MPSWVEDVSRCCECEKKAQDVLRLHAGMERLQYEMNTRYWDGIRDANTKLRAEVGELKDECAALREVDYTTTEIVMQRNTIDALRAEVERLQGEHSDVADRLIDTLAERDALRARAEKAEELLRLALPHIPVEHMQSVNAFLVEKADALKAHVARCPEHPMSALREALEEIASWEPNELSGRDGTGECKEIARAALHWEPLKEAPNG